MLVYLTIDYGKKMILPFDEAMTLLKIYGNAKFINGQNYEQGGYKNIQIGNAKDLPVLTVVPDDIAEIIQEGELLQVEHMSKFLEERGIHINL